MSDAYESSYMTGEGEVLYRDKLVWRAGVAILGIPALASLTGAALIAAGIDPSAGLVFALAPLVPGVILGACAALLTVLRVVVTTREVQVQYGLWGPTVPVAAITSCEVVDYDWTEYGGWGIRRAGNGDWAYTIMGKGRRVVRIAWTAEGKTRRIVVSAEDPVRLAAAIELARSGAIAPGLRVELDDETEEEEEEEEVDAEGSERERSRRGA